MLLVSLLAVAVAGGWETHGPELPNSRVVAVSAADTRRVYALAGNYGSETAVFRSDDTGQTWRRVFDAPPGQFLGTLSVDPRNPNRVFAATSQAGPRSHFATSFYRSVDGGETWTVPLAVGDAPLCSVVFDGLQPNTIYIACGGRLSLFFRSEDGGDSFEGGWAPFFGAPELQIAPDDALLGVAPGTIWGSRDGGLTWSIPIGVPGGCSITSLVIDPANPNRMFVSEGYTQTFCGQVLRSVDGGLTWSPAASVGGPALDLVMDPSDPSLIYVSTSPVGDVPGRVLVSDDDGESWKDLELPLNARASDLAITEGGDRLYAATPAGVYSKSLRRTREIPARP